MYPSLLPNTAIICFATEDNKQSGLSVPTSSGISRFLLDTYNNIGEDEAAELASANGAGTGDNTRPPRYGAFVFGDRFPVNVTVDWDELRERPELLAESLKVLSEALPTEGGEFDLKVRFLGCISWCVKIAREGVFSGTVG